MEEYFYTELIGKSIVSERGERLGVLRKIYADMKTGNLVYFAIEPYSRDVEALFDKDEEGLVLVPTSRISAIKDFIIIKYHD